MSLQWWLLKRLGAWFMIWAALLATLALGLRPELMSGQVAWWAPVGCCFALACGSCWLRMRQLGEDHAWAASGHQPRDLVLPALLLGLSLQACAALVPGTLPRTHADPRRVQRSVDGRLYGRGVLLSSTGPMQALPRRPADFRPWPHNPDRYRRQAMLRLPLRPAGRDPLDPWILRLCCAALLTLLPALLLVSRRGWGWGLALLPLLLLA